MPNEDKFTLLVKEKPKINKDMIEYPCLMFLDQATKTGLCIYDNRKRLVTTLRITKNKTDDIVKFRNMLKSKLQELIEEFKIVKLFCEDVFGGENFNTTQKLLSIRDLIMDLAYENKIKAYPLVNTKWKSRLSYPNRWRKSTDENSDKDQIAEYVKLYYPLIRFEDDVLDSVGMAIAALFKVSDNKILRPLEMSLDKKLKVETEIIVPSNQKLDIYNNEHLDIIVNETKLKKYAGRLEYKMFDYDTTLDLLTNFRYILTSYDVIAVTKIPYHRYYGQILLKYDIIPSEIPKGVELIGIASRR